jgi:hypothetical protein
VVGWFGHYYYTFIPTEASAMVKFDPIYFSTSLVVSYRLGTGNSSTIRTYFSTQENA